MDEGSVQSEEIAESSQELVTATISFPDGRKVYAYSGLQCVDLVQRFSGTLTLGKVSYFPVYYAKELCSIALPSGYTRVYSSPRKFDIFVRSTNGDNQYSVSGHTAVVESVSGGYMTVVQQNRSPARETVSTTKFAGNQCFLRWTGATCTSSSTSACGNYGCGCKWGVCSGGYCPTVR